MNKPDPNSTRIRGFFIEDARNTKPFDELEDLKKQGSFIFDDDDPIMSSTNELDRLVVKYCRDNSVTAQYFAARYNQYSTRVQGYLQAQASTNRANLLKALRKGNITVRVFFAFIKNVFGFTIDNLAMTMRDPRTNIPYTCYLNDVEDETGKDEPKKKSTTRKTKTAKEAK